MCFSQKFCGVFTDLRLRDKLLSELDVLISVIHLYFRQNYLSQLKLQIKKLKNWWPAGTALSSKDLIPIMRSSSAIEVSSISVAVSSPISRISEPSFR